MGDKSAESVCLLVLSLLNCMTVNLCIRTPNLVEECTCTLIISWVGPKVKGQTGWLSGQGVRLVNLGSWVRIHLKSVTVQPSCLVWAGTLVALYKCEYKQSNFTLLLLYFHRSRKQDWKKHDFHTFGYVDQCRFTLSWHVMAHHYLREELWAMAQE